MRYQAVAKLANLYLDLVRCESMNSLDPSVCTKILQKKYRLVIRALIAAQKGDRNCWVRV